jgi:uncharacterized protein (DUF1800 family)
MKPTLPFILTAASVALCAAWAGVAHSEPEPQTPPLAVHMPWKAAGLTDRQAAAHLLNRFAFGPRPGEVDAVVRMGLDRWMERQLAANLPDAKSLEDLRELPALGMSNEQIFKVYPPAGVILVQAKQAGIIPDDIKKGDLKNDLKNKENDAQREELKAKVKAFADAQGYRPEKELIAQLMTQKLVRAVESENQLEEVMTDFWYNHFNVSQTDNKAKPFLLSYERDAIRPNALGSFRGLLEATAKSPAMLVYLDNAQSTAAAGEPTTMQDEMDRTPRQRARFGARGAPVTGDPDPTMARFSGQGMLAARQNRLARSPLAPKRKQQQGVNENYARELMELHTLGVDGGYTQQDVIEVARAFTGWTVLPEQPKVRAAAETRLARAERVGGLGFVQEGDFLFRADQHDAAAKTILGTRFPAGRGIEDGEAVLDLLAANRATARHIATKLAVRFVSDHPPQALVDRLTDVYLRTGGDIHRLVAAIAESPEFWSRDAIGAKIKSPFELTASALRITGADVIDPSGLFRWINRMGQPLYAYQAPTGYPDRAEAWVNTGSLLNRMNFGLLLAANRVRGVSVDLAALDSGHEPASREDALHTYAALLMPGRDLNSALKLLGPMVADPNLAKRVDQAAPKDAGKAAAKADSAEDLLEGRPEMAMQGPRTVKVRGLLGDEPKEPVDRRPPSPLAQVVGVILGSPEFQRR